MAVEGTAQSSDPAGRFGKYEIIAKIGQGAMGEVYKARDTVLDRFVAIKTMSAAVLGDPELGQRFLREAQSAARLNHPNVVTLHEFGEEAGRLFMAMELLEGEDLKGLLKRGGLATLEDKLAIMEQILDGVAYAHAAGVIHRDLKPANIHVQANGHVKVMDFGLARLGESEMTRAGTVMGTPNYMSPEQVRGERAGPPSDVFALGAVFYEVIGGRRAFEADSMHAVLYKVTNSDPIPLAEYFPDAPPIIETFLWKALAKDPELRYRDGNEMRQALELCRRVLDGSLEEGATIAALGEAPTMIQAPDGTDATLAQMEATTGVAPTVALPRRGASGQSGSFPSVRRGTRTGSKPPVTPGRAPRAEAPASSPATAAAPSRAPLYIGAAAIAVLILAGTALVLKRPQAPVAAPEDRQAKPLVSVITQATQPEAPAFKPQAEAAKEVNRVPEAAGRPDASPVRALKPGPPPATTTAAAAPPNTTAVAVPAKPPAPLPTLAPAPPSPIAAVLPPPTTSAPPPTLGDEAAVRQLVASLERAIEEKDLALYKKLRPGLTPEDERRLRDAFNNVSSQQVDYSVDAISFDGDKATLHVTRTGRVSGQAVPPIRQVLRLARTATGWVIAEIGQ
jgi:serine/threonine-protein kinase